MLLKLMKKLISLMNIFAVEKKEKIMTVMTAKLGAVNNESWNFDCHASDDSDGSHNS